MQGSLVSLLDWKRWRNFLSIHFISDLGVVILIGVPIHMGIITCPCNYKQTHVFTCDLGVAIWTGVPIHMGIIATHVLHMCSSGIEVPIQIRWITTNDVIPKSCLD